MRRIFLTSVFALALTSLVAAPAAAQRDPFIPLDGDANVAPEEQPGPGVDEPVVEPPPSGALTNTGWDPTPWVALAAALIVLGAAALLAARLQSPLPRPTR